MNHSFYLLEALKLAKLRQGFTAPNPAVGAIITDINGHILARGYHQAAGQAHAEIEALKQLNSHAQAHTLYVTLEPCCYFGKTPPCTEAIIKSGIKRVVYGYRDPNPKVSGEGAKQLKAKGIECFYEAVSAINELYSSYHYWQIHRRPYLICKIAISLDGKISGIDGKPIALTGDTINLFTHENRLISDALFTTSTTINHDNPQFNCRIGNQVTKKNIYVLDRNLTLNLNAKILETAQMVTVFYMQNDLSKLKQFETAGVRCIPMASSEHSWNLSEILAFMGNEGVHRLWSETGGTLLSALLNENLVNELLIYVAPKWIGKGISAFNDDFQINFKNFHPPAQKSLGEDVLYHLKKLSEFHPC